LLQCREPITTKCYLPLGFFFTVVGRRSAGLGGEGALFDVHIALQLGDPRTDPLFNGWQAADEGGNRKAADKSASIPVQPVYIDDRALGEEAEVAQEFHEIR